MLKLHQIFDFHVLNHDVNYRWWFIENIMFQDADVKAQAQKTYKTVTELWLQRQERWNFNGSSQGWRHVFPMLLRIEIQG